MAECSNDDVPYRDRKLDVRQRVADLMSRMTLEEKAAQLFCIWNLKRETLLDEHGRFDRSKAAKHYGNGNGLGQVGRPADFGSATSPRESAELTNAIQRFFVENTRLGIPVVFHDECLHGHVAPGA